MGTEYIKPKHDCPNCRGSGIVHDWVLTPFGPGNCDMPSICDCVTEQALYEDSTIAIVEAAEEGE